MNLQDLKEINFINEAHQIASINEVLVEKIGKSAGLNDSDSQELLIEALKFIFLVGVTKQKLTPSLPVDLAWHELILFTKFYAEYCEEKFGFFIHHHPGGKEEENKSQYSKTMKLYALYIGNPPTKYWGDAAKEYGDDLSCGTDF